MNSYRVYQIGKENNLTSKEVIDICIKLGIDIKSHSSSVGDEDYKKIIDSLKMQKINDVKVTGHTVMISSMTTSEENYKFPWKIIGPLLVIPLIAGFIVFFARFEPKTKK